MAAVKIGVVARQSFLDWIAREKENDEHELGRLIDVKCATSDHDRVASTDDYYEAIEGMRNAHPKEHNIALMSPEEFSTIEAISA